MGSGSADSTLDFERADYTTAHLRWRFSKSRAVRSVAALVRASSSEAHPTGDRAMFALFARLIVALALIAALPMQLGSR